MQFIARTLASARTPLSRRQRLGLLALLVVGTGLLLAGCASTRPPPGVTAVTLLTCSATRAAGTNWRGSITRSSAV